MNIVLISLESDVSFTYSTITTEEIENEVRGGLHNHIANFRLFYLFISLITKSFSHKHANYIQYVNYVKYVNIFNIYLDWT